MPHLEGQVEVVDRYGGCGASCGGKQRLQQAYQGRFATALRGRDTYLRGWLPAEGASVGVGVGDVLGLSLRQQLSEKTMHWLGAVRLFR